MNQPTTGRQSYAWKYIENHQDDDYSDIAKHLGFSEENTKTLGLYWAMGDDKKFLEKLINIKSVNKATQIAQNSHYGK